MKLNINDITREQLPVFGTQDHARDYTGDEFDEYFTTLEEAVRSAERQWVSLTRAEQDEREIEVVRYEKWDDTMDSLSPDCDPIECFKIMEH